MICEECKRDEPLTYRSVTLHKRSVCVDCMRRNHSGVGAVWQNREMGALGRLVRWWILRRDSMRRRIRRRR